MGPYHRCYTLTVDVHVQPYHHTIQVTVPIPFAQCSVPTDACICTNTYNFKGVEADIFADISVLVEPVLGEGAALEVHAEFRKELHDQLVRLGPRLPVLLAADDIIQHLQSGLLLVHVYELCVWEQSGLDRWSGLLIEHLVECVRPHTRYKPLARVRAFSSFWKYIGIFVRVQPLPDHTPTHSEPPLPIFRVAPRAHGSFAPQAYCACALSSW